METKSSNSKVKFKPHEKQEEFIAAVFSGRYNFLVYGGAMGGGKSYVCIAILILLCKLYPGSKWCIIRASLPTLKKTSIPTFWKVVPRNFMLSYNQQDQVVTFTNGSQIMFMTEDYANDKDFDRFKGLEVNGFLLEQIEELQEGLLDVCFIRSGRHIIEKQPKPLILANVNPTLTWPKDKIYNAWVEKRLPEKWYYLPAKITDNPSLSENSDYMENLVHLDSTTKRRLIEGDWSAFVVKSPYLYNFSIETHVKKGIDLNPFLDLWVSFDFNHTPMTCGIAQRYNLTTLKVFKEYELNNSDPEEVCDRIKASFPEYLQRLKVTGDASGNNRIAAKKGLTCWKVVRDKLNLKDSQIKVRSKNLALEDSKVLCNSILEHATVEIDESCKGVINDCIHAQVDENGKLIKDNDTAGNHHLDWLRYLLDANFPDFIDNPRKYQK